MLGPRFDEPSKGITERLQRALANLLEAFEYSVDTESNPWDFAVPMQSLHVLGLNETDLRWLVRKGYVEHAREVTVPGDDGRAFRPTGNLTFTRRTCFVLTEAGLSVARLAAEPGTTLELSGGRLSGKAGARSEGNGRAAQRAVVYWDMDARKLCVNGELVKRYKWPATNQEAVLNAFQEEGWPDRIDDPLPPQPDQESKRRLSDTIKCLNRKQVRQLIHFRGDGTGEGVVWEFVPPESNGIELE